MKSAKQSMAAKELRKLLSDAKVSQVKLAEMLGVEKGTVNRWVNGKFKINPFIVPAIREALKK